ncbi:MAG: hypothetical protein QM729_07290 [Solirubrobacterales bacterium]
MVEYKRLRDRPPQRPHEPVPKLDAGQRVEPKVHEGQLTVRRLHLIAEHVAHLFHEELEQAIVGGVSPPAASRSSGALGKNLPQLVSLRLPGGRPGKALYEMDLVRILEVFELFPTDCPKISLEISRCALIINIERFDKCGDPAVPGNGDADDTRPSDAWMALEYPLDVQRRHPEPTHLEHVVIPTNERVGPVGPALQSIARPQPSIGDRSFRLLWSMPVEGGLRWPAHLRDPTPRPVELGAVLVDQAQFVPRHRPPCLAGSTCARSVRTIGLQHLGRTQGVHDLKPEALDPCVVGLNGQRLRSRDAQAGRLKCRTRVRVSGQGTVDGRHGEEDRGTELLQGRPNASRRRLAGQKDRRGAAVERKAQTVPEAVGVMELRR